MVASGDRVVQAAQLASAALGAIDAGYAYLLPKPGSIPERIMGPGSGAWHEWGVGLLASAAAIHARAVVAPSERSLAAVALLRATVAPGHIALFALEPTTRKRSVGLFAMNATAALLSWRASRRMAP